jgi:RNA polymerase sigma-70 factor, ECF subfamily
LYQEAADGYGAALDRLANAYEANPEERRDLLQDIHVGLWRSFGAFDGRCSLRTWVYRVAHNIATSHVIRQKRNNSALVTLEAIEAMPAVQDDAYEQRANLERLMALVQRLKPLDRQMTLLYLEGMDAASIGRSWELRREAWRPRFTASRAYSPGSFTKEKAMPVDDVRRLWQAQPRESVEVDMQEIRDREESLKAAARRQAMLWYGRAAVFFVVAALNLVVGRHPVTDRLVGVLWFSWGLGLVRRGREVRKQMGPRRFAADIVLRTSLEGYRHELEQARDFSPRSWELLAIAVVVGSLALEKTPGLWLNVVLLAAVPVIWIGGTLISRVRRRGVQQELDEIDSLMREAQ